MLKRQTMVKLLPVAGAVAAAVGVLVLHGVATDDGWPWVDFGDDLIRNLLIGGLVAYAVLWLETSERARAERAAADAARKRERRQVMRVREVALLAASGWSPISNSSDDSLTEGARLDRIISETEKRVAELRELAVELEIMYESEPDDDTLLPELLMLPWKLYGYLQEGGRARRFAYLDVLGRELADLEDAPDSLGTRVSAFRASLPGAFAWRIHTDATIVERLLVEQIVDGAHLSPATAENRQLRDVVGLDPAAIAREPVYLLLAYAVVQFHGLSEPQEAQRRFAPVKRSIGALRNEMRAVATALEELALVIDVVRKRATA